MTMTLPELKPSVYPSTIFCGLRGSHSHGTYVPPTEPTSIDDVDYLTVEMPSLVDCFGAIQGRWSGKDSKDGALDVASYEFRHYVSLLHKGNPNVVSTLWVAPEFIVHKRWPYETLRAHRAMFMTKRLAIALSGYAYSQMKRMTAFQKYEGYMGEKRKQLVDRFGYDTKNAAHLIRLLRMGKEAMQTGELTVLRPDAEELVRIKQGKLSFADVEALAEIEWRAYNEAVERSSLPAEPDVDMVNLFTTEILRSWFHMEEVCKSRPAELGKFGVDPR